MNCVGCNREEAHDWYGDAFCDSCGGVMARPELLIFRHVATVDGLGGRLPIVWDESTSDYKFRYPHKPNPSKKLRKHGIDQEFISRIPRFLTVHGSLDGVLDIALPIAKGEGEEVELSAAPTSTLEERALLGV